MDVPDTLDEAWRDAWSRLGRATADRQHPWRTPTLATVAPDGTPRARVVVLRGVERDPPCLAFHTDLRSHKLADLEGVARVAWTFWDPRAKVQLRVQCRVEVLREGPEWQAAWDGTSLLGRRTYVCEPGPGTPLDQPGSGLPEPVRAGRVEARDVAHGARVFGRVRCPVLTVDRLDLAIRGHRRARWTLTEDGAHGTWVVP
jgi:pyridoxamine 5'-phosphate oxidase